MKKRTKRKVYPLFNPIEHAIAGALITDNEILNKFRLLELTSIESFRTGTATRVDWENLARMMNVCEVSAEMGIGAEALPSCQCLQEALIEAQERFKKIGRYGLSGVGLKATIRSDGIQFIAIFLLFFYLIFSIFFQNNNNLNLNIFDKNFIKFDSKSLITSFQFGFVFFIAVAATNLFHQGNWQRVYAAKNDKVLVKSLLISFVIIFVIVLSLGLTGSISKLNGFKFNEDLAFFSIILNKCTFINHCTPGI